MWLNTLWKLSLERLLIIHWKIDCAKYNYKSPKYCWKVAEKCHLILRKDCWMVTERLRKKSLNSVEVFFCESLLLWPIFITWQTPPDSALFPNIIPGIKNSENYVLCRSASPKIWINVSFFNGKRLAMLNYSVPMGRVLYPRQRGVETSQAM